MLPNTFIKDLFEISDGALDRFGASNDVRGNLQKARVILNKSLTSIAAARASTSRTDKTFLCDKDYVNLAFIK